MGNRSVTCRSMSAPVAVMPTKIGPSHWRMAAEVFSPSAVWASSQMTIEYASETLPALRTNHWYVSTVTGPLALYLSPRRSAGAIRLR